jgi:hypothetical protein
MAPARKQRAGKRELFLAAAFLLTNPGRKPSVIYQGEDVAGSEVYERQPGLK